ncbi:1318_t:CDS:1 [Funneliformis geosporum]|uniref:1318_t:CDS:1 n=1 Tax=Funneliformis geosporum TaxID=1117311 RepID=A0A9W4WHC7_9GLOM|nr:1318_t:CDS:1 [Funneliformis geosporum]
MNWDNKKNPINIGFPLSSENRKKYQEGIDYKIEEMGGGFRKYHLLSEKLKADIRRYNGGDFGGVITEQEGFIPPQIPEELARKIKEENKIKRRKFIAENNPPQNLCCFPTAEENA